MKKFAGILFLSLVMVAGAFAQSSADIDAFNFTSTAAKNVKFSVTLSEGSTAESVRVYLQKFGDQDFTVYGLQTTDNVNYARDVFITNSSTTERWHVMGVEIIDKDGLPNFINDRELWLRGILTDFIINPTKSRKRVRFTP